MLLEVLDRMETPPDAVRLAKPVTVSMPGGLWGRVDAVADALGCNRSFLIRTLVERSLRELEEEMAQSGQFPGVGRDDE